MPTANYEDPEALAYAGRVSRLTIEESTPGPLGDDLIRVTMELVRDRGSSPDHACKLTISFVMCREGRTLEQLQHAAFEHGRKLLQYSPQLRG
ncbi:hypothetical protein B551_0222635 [Cupriavidus sp. HPC(L)]|nr:hypothetical protein B551_0222635 [Cupriavidus sp. HPC(L)]